MWLVLSASSDAAAAWAAAGLRARGLYPLLHLTAETLAFGVTWEHRIDGNGAQVSFSLPSGLTVCSGDVRGALNRLLAAPLDAAMLAQPADREYAQQEIAAFFMSWLEALPGPVLNRPTAQGLSGAWRHPSEWMVLAAEAGLPTAQYVLSSRPGASSAPAFPADSAIVADDDVIGPSLDPALREGCRRLAALARTPLLGVDFGYDATGQRVFVGATPQPELRRGGALLLDVLARVLAAESDLTPTSDRTDDPVVRHTV